jgi:hypothetical protein
MSGAIPDKEVTATLSTTHLRPPSSSHHHHKHHQSAFDLRAKYKTTSASASRPIEVRRKKSTAPIVAVFEDPTIQNISAGPYANTAANTSLGTNTNKENTPAAHHVDEGSGSLPALSSSEWLAGPTTKKREATVLARPRSSPPKAGGLGESGIGNWREGSSPGQRLVISWIPNGSPPSVKPLPSETSCRVMTSDAPHRIPLTECSGIFLASWFQDKYGYRRTIQASLILMTCFIFVVFL